MKIWNEIEYPFFPLNYFLIIQQYSKTSSLKSC